jgi:hypothetical protein
LNFLNKREKKYPIQMDDPIQNLKDRLSQIWVERGLALLAVYDEPSTLEGWQWMPSYGALKRDVKPP